MPTTAPRPSRVLLAGPIPPPVNGMSTAFALVVTGLPALGWDVEVADLADRTASRPRGSFTIARLWSATWCVGRALARIPRRDVFYLTMSQSRLGFVKDLPMLLWAMAWRVPIVVHLHGGNVPALWARLGLLGRALFRFAYGRVASILVLADCFKDQFRGLGAATPPLRVVANATALPLAEAPRRSHGGPFRMLYLSNMHVEKGYLDALAVLDLLSATELGRPIEVHFCGSFSVGGTFTSRRLMEDDFRLRCRSVPAGCEVVYHGYVSGDAKLSLLDQCDVLLCPSRIPEGQPLAIVEALTRGLPVAAYDWPGIREMLPGALARGLAPVGDVAALARVLSALSSQVDGYSETSRAALHAAERFRPETHLALLSQCLQQAAVASHQGRSAKP